MWKTCALSGVKWTGIGTSSALRVVPSRPADGDEEVEQHGLVALVDEHVAPRAEAGQRALRHARGQNRGDGRIDGVAALTQDPRARLGGQRMPGCDDPSAHGVSLRPGCAGNYFPGRNSGTSTPPRSRGRDSKLLAVPGRRSSGLRSRAWLVPTSRRSEVELPSPAAAASVVAGGDDGHPDLVAERLVDVGAEDDVGVGVRGLLDHLGGLADLHQRQVSGRR